VSRNPAWVSGVYQRAASKLALCLADTHPTPTPDSPINGGKGRDWHVLSWTGSSGRFRWNKADRREPSFESVPRTRCGETCDVLIAAKAANTKDEELERAFELEGKRKWLRK